MSLLLVLQVVLAIVAAVFAALHKKLPRLLGFTLMGVAGAAIAVMSIVDWLIMKGWVPFLAPLGIELVIGTVIAAFAVRTSSPSAGDDTTGGPTESLPRWAKAVTFWR